MKLPKIYKRLLIEQIILHQSPDTQRQLKALRSPWKGMPGPTKSLTGSTPRSAAGHAAKRLKFEDERQNNAHVDLEGM